MDFGYGFYKKYESQPKTHFIKCQAPIAGSQGTSGDVRSMHSLLVVSAGPHVKT